MKSSLKVSIHNGFDISFRFSCFNCVGCLIPDLSSSDSGSVFVSSGCSPGKNLYSKNW